MDINPSKSEVFFSTVPQDVKGQILDVLQFKEGTLPVRYLGLPLISGSLRLKDCQPLIDKIQGSQIVVIKETIFRWQVTTPSICSILYTKILVK